MARIALTRDKIVQATIELAGKIGLSNVSFPRLAEYFGIRHFIIILKIWKKYVWQRQSTYKKN